MTARVIRWVGVMLLLAACDERERLTFPSNDPGDDIGPVTNIEQPAHDTVITEGDLLLLSGRSFDETGVDTVYFTVSGSNQSFLPFAAEGQDTVTFGLSLSTIGLSNRTVTVEVLGVDLEGNRGEVATRRLSIQ